MQTIPFGSGSNSSSPTAIPFNSSTQVPTPILHADSLWQNLVKTTGQNQVAGGKKIVDAVQSGADALSKPSDVVTKTGALLQTGLNAAGGAADVITAPFTAVLTKLLGNSGGAASITAPKGNPSQIGEAVQTWAQQHPDAVKGLQSALSIAGVAGIDAMPELQGNALDSLKTADSGIAQPIKEANNKFLAPDTNKPDLVTLQEKIAPKVDANAIKLALKEGRIMPGQDPTLLRDGTPDQILPSDVSTKATFTVAKQIPNVNDLSTPEIHAELGNKISETAKGLRPAMEATPVSENTVTQITNAWKALKSKQLNDPYTPSTVDVSKLQKNFEENFLQKSASDNFGNLWDTRIKYDNSVPTNVKNATSLSSDVLQTQKSFWLQNRGILNSAINDASSGLGKTSQQAFSDMNDMYNAQKGIESSYQLPKETNPSGIKNFFKNTTAGKAIKTVAGGGTVFEVGKKLLTGHF